jgi:hypothetical protein
MFPEHLPLWSEVSKYKGNVSYKFWAGLCWCQGRPTLSLE